MNHQNGSSSSSSRKTTYRKRKKTLKKKAQELSILCGVPVGLVCIEPDGMVETWPEERHKIHQILQDYVAKANLNSISEPNKKIFQQKKKRANYETWDPRLDYLPEDSLMDIFKCLEFKEKILEERLRLGDGKNKRGLHYNGDGGLSKWRLDCLESVAKQALGSWGDEKSKSWSSVSHQESDCDLSLKLFNNGESALNAMPISMKPAQTRFDFLRL